jgi:hypothetical protein
MAGRDFPREDHPSQDPGLEDGLDAILAELSKEGGDGGVRLQRHDVEVADNHLGVY